MWMQTTHRCSLACFGEKGAECQAAAKQRCWAHRPESLEDYKVEIEASGVLVVHLQRARGLLLQMWA